MSWLVLASGANGEPWWISLIKSVIVINLVLFGFAYLTLVERKVMGRMQLRYGPNRAGPYGLMQPIADLVKLIRKESFFPAEAVDVLYIFSPFIAAFTALTTFSVIPWGEGWTIAGYHVNGYDVAKQARQTLSESPGARAAETAAETDGWVTTSSSAAPVTDPWRTTARKAESWVTVTAMTGRYSRFPINSSVFLVCARAGAVRPCAG